MAVAIILLTIISIFAVGIAVLVFQPALFDLSYETNFWKDPSNVDVRLNIMRDTLYSGTIAIPIFMIGIVALWAYLAVNRRDDL